ncbi:hypothetical protein PP175_28695 (plasmid) [Aneurinibacillus sp. Ricciae_BoGa-3]|uniref:hypothetical protein n=1 Tax=Aneurinibacillus sp. Ricciae_BoGa-3 TaxID=3022697 RepID=UPI002342276E|nr:hypothetical protein [Aneurinibacillus sp. Ricciae_BoGa-3]WCK57169.1 hypothetical protein PP175_28695 [Aneurinibacillus sp. Ricciae_BoGa-3]
MKLTKKEVGLIRNMAFFVNVLDRNAETMVQEHLDKIPEKKRELALAYFQFLTRTDGVKSYVVDFKASGAGHLTYHHCTVEEAHNKALYALQNGAFGKHEKLEDIVIQKVSPETIYHNQFEDFVQATSAA